MHTELLNPHGGVWMREALMEILYMYWLCYSIQGLFVVPPLTTKNIPFTRVNHNKYMVTDNAAYIGTASFYRCHSDCHSAMYSVAIDTVDYAHGFDPLTPNPISGQLCYVRLCCFRQCAYVMYNLWEVSWHACRATCASILIASGHVILAQKFWCGIIFGELTPLVKTSNKKEINLFNRDV